MIAITIGVVIFYIVHLPGITNLYLIHRLIDHNFPKKEMKYRKIPILINDNALVIRSRVLMKWSFYLATLIRCRMLNSDLSIWTNPQRMSNPRELETHQGGGSADKKFVTNRFYNYDLKVTKKIPGNVTLQSLSLDSQGSVFLSTFDLHRQA
jgi:hypothetical protein